MTATTTATAVFIPSPGSDKTRQLTAYDSDASGGCLQDGRDWQARHSITIASIKQAAAAVVGRMHSALTYQPVARCSVCRRKIQGKY
jgi:hypothetical protein